MDAISAAPIASGVSTFRGRAIVAVATRARVAVGFGLVPFFAAPFAVPFAAVPFFSARVRVGGDASVATGAARRVGFRAGREAGVDCAGSSARVRGATIVLKV
jgi:hypothetical protein